MIGGVVELQVVRDGRTGLHKTFGALWCPPAQKARNAQPTWSAMPPTACWPARSKKLRRSRIKNILGGFFGPHFCTKKGPYAARAIIGKRALIAKTWSNRWVRTVFRNPSHITPIERFGEVVAHPILGGLHYRYARI
jgi:hypothetical protein